MYIWKQTLWTPIEPTKLLTLENLLDINNELKEDALRDPRIEYAGNHRTALYAVELFLKKNGYFFNYTPEESYEFRKELYSRRLRQYKTYEERPASILKEEDNQVFSFCLEFVRSHARLT